MHAQYRTTKSSGPDPLPFYHYSTTYLYYYGVAMQLLDFMHHQYRLVTFMTYKPMSKENNRMKSWNNINGNSQTQVALHIC